MDLRIFPPEELPDCEIILPLSKSISNRALIINALTAGAQPLEAVAQCDDTRAMTQALVSSSHEVNIGAAGTAMRFLTAYFAVKEGSEVTLDGSERMRKRPIAPLVDALRSLGAKIEYAGEEGFPPLNIYGTRLSGGEVEIDASVSSQYISALLMVAPVMERGLTLVMTGDAVSLPYIRLTLEVMRSFGVKGSIEGNTVTVPHGSYTPAPDFRVEGDWSAASYWYEIQALSCGWTRLDGLRKMSAQGDSACASLFANLGVETEFEGSSACLQASPDLAPRYMEDLTSTPDIAQTIAVTCATLGVPFNLAGLQSLRIKETDRIAALSAELLKLGVVVTVEGDSLIWDGSRRPILEMPVIDTYDDHRMAMAFAPVAVFVPGIIIRNAEVVSKSYPDFWKHMQSAGFKLEEVEPK